MIAHQALRVSRGQLPYADFQTAYTPAGFYLHALLFDAFGPQLVLLRKAAAVACAATAALLTLAAARVLPAPADLLPALLYVVLEDQESRGLVVHMIAYPARYVQTLWAASLCLSLAYGARPSRLRAGLLGLVTAGILALKHTAGIYNAWAVGLIVVLTCLSQPATRPDHRLLRLVPLAFLLAVLAGPPVLGGGFGDAGSRVALVVIYLPVAALAALLLPRVLPFGGGAGRRAALATAGGHLLWLAAGALGPTALWVAYFAAHAGGRVLLQRLVLDGPAVAASYAVALPRPVPLTVAIMVLAGVVVGCHLLVRRGRLPRSTAGGAVALACAALGVAVLLGCLPLVRQALQIGDFEPAVLHAGRAADNAGLYLTLGVALAFVPLLPATARGTGPVAAVVVCWIHGVCQLAQLYPRIDAAHLYDSCAILLIPATMLLHRAVGAFGPGPGRVRWLAVAAACAVAGVVGLKLGPRLDAQLAWHDGLRLEARTPLASPRGGLYGTGLEGERLADLNRLLTRIAARTAPGGPLFAYPALSAVYFLGGYENPAPLDYLYRGFGEGRDEVAVITALEARRVPVVVSMSDPSFDPAHADHFPMLKDYLARHFAPSEVIGEFQIFERVR